MSGLHTGTSNVKLTADDLGRIAIVMADLYDVALHRSSLRDSLLDAVMGMIPCKGPCSLLQLNDFYSNGGAMDIKRTVHRNAGGIIGEVMLKAWYAHVKMRDSPIERALHKQSLKIPAGAGRLDDLIKRKAWNSTREGKLAARFRITDLAYSWVRCSDSDIWAIALRRYRDEPRFSERDCQVMEAFAASLHHARSRWYIYGLDKLTETEQRVLLAWRRYVDKQAVVANRIGMALGTYRKHLENISEKLGANSAREAEAVLLDRFRPKTLTRGDNAIQRP